MSVCVRTPQKMKSRMSVSLTEDELLPIRPKIRHRSVSRISGTRKKKRNEPEVKSLNFYDSFYSPFDGGTNIRFERRKPIERRASHPTPHLMYEVRSAF